MHDEIRGYRQAAARCLRLAQRTTDPQTRVELIHLAQKWLQFANDDFELRRIVLAAEGLINPKSSTSG
jgi:hypothetical protein